MAREESDVSVVGARNRTTAPIPQNLALLSLRCTSSSRNSFPHVDHREAPPAFLGRDRFGEHTCSCANTWRPARRPPRSRLQPA